MNLLTGNRTKIFAILYLLFFLFIVLPIVYTFGNALILNNSFINNLNTLNKKTLFLLFNSSAIAFTVAFFSTLLGTLFGFLLYKTNVSSGKVLKILFLIPLLISPYILAAAWKDFFFFIFHDTKIVASYYGVIAVLILIYTPLAMLITGSAFSNINSQLEDSGLMFTNLRNVIFKIELPLIKPALLSSFVLIFIFSVSEFSVPAFLGVKVFTTEIFTQFSAFYNHSLAILQSLLLVVICIALLFSEKKYISDAPFLSFGSKGSNKKIFYLKKSKMVFTLLVAWFFVSVIVPFVTLFVQSFRNGTTDFIKSFELLKNTIPNSITLALLAALLIVITGFISAYFSHNKNSGFVKSFDWILLIVFAIPSIVYGISFIKFYNKPFLEFIYSGYAIIVIAYVGKFSFLSAKIIGNAIKQVPNSLIEAAEMEGVTFFSAIKKILLPLIMPGILIAFVIGFIFSLGELATTIMLYPPGTELMPVKVFTITANASQALASSITLIVLSITLLMIIFFFIAAKFFIKSYGFYDD